MFNKEEKFFYEVQWSQEENGRCYEFVNEFDSPDEQDSFVAELLCRSNVWDIHSYITREVQWKREGDRPEDFCYNKV